MSMKLRLAGMGGAPAQTYVDDVFSTWLYTGNGSTQTITNGIDLAGKGGMVWTKSRSNATAHVLTDSARGLTNPFYTIATDPQTSGITTMITSFNSNGFSLGDDSQLDRVNVVSNTYASWTFRKAAKFFDVVTYTGNGVSGRFINHSLTIRPGLMFIKRTDTTSNWVVMSNALSYSMWLNSTNADVSSNNVNGYIQDFTASSFQVNAGSTSINAVNASGGTYVAYLFAHDTAADGIIQCGSYTGNGGTTDATGQNITLGWEPQYLLVKSATTTSGNNSWAILDTMRGWDMTEGNDRTVYANTSAAENAGLYGNPTSTGFRVWDSNVNASGVNYIYMAIRRPNKPPTTGTQVFSPNVVATDLIGATTGFPVDLCFDALRGVSAKYVVSRLTGGNYLETNSTNNETINASDWSQSNTGINNNGIGLIGGSAVYWNFKRAPGFFDEVCYTGTGVARTVAHNLGVAPEMIITKQRSGTNNWFTYHATLGATNWVALNLTNASTTSSAVWNDTAPTSTVFTVGTASNNTSGATLVAYLFATLAGISKVGSYTGNGSSQNIDCGFAAGARFVLIKRTDNTGDWFVWDTVRGIVAANDPHLSLNTTAAEVTTDDSIDPYSAGFTVNQVAATNINVSSATYIYLAIA